MTKRLRLSLGPRQVERLLLAISYTIDTFQSEDEASEIGQYEKRTIRDYEALREVIRRARVRQGR